jgi:hypothetical protein
MPDSTMDGPRGVGVRGVDIVWCFACIFCCLFLFSLLSLSLPLSLSLSLSLSFSPSLSLNLVLLVDNVYVKLISARSVGFRAFLAQKKVQFRTLMSNKQAMLCTSVDTVHKPLLSFYNSKTQAKR